jgi:hypothetical protein
LHFINELLRVFDIATSHTRMPDRAHARERHEMRSRLHARTDYSQALSFFTRK